MTALDELKQLVKHQDIEQSKKQIVNKKIKELQRLKILEYCTMQDYQDVAYKLVDEIRRFSYNFYGLCDKIDEDIRTLQPLSTPQEITCKSKKSKTHTTTKQRKAKKKKAIKPQYTYDDVDNIAQEIMQSINNQSLFQTRILDRLIWRIKSFLKRK